MQVHFEADVETQAAITELAKRERRSKASVVRLLVQIGLAVSRGFPSLMVAVNTTSDDQIISNLLHMKENNDG